MKLQGSGIMVTCQITHHLAGTAQSAADWASCLPCLTLPASYWKSFPQNPILDNTTRQRPSQTKCSQDVSAKTPNFPTIQITGRAERDGLDRRAMGD